MSEWELPDTGLPTTPKGTIWRIVEEKEVYLEFATIDAYIQMQLVAPDVEYVKKRAFRPSITLRKDIVLAQRAVKKHKLITSKNPEQDLYELACDILDARENLERVNALLGDYPPKVFPEF